MGSPGTRYSEQFKAEAVSQVIDRGYSVAEVSQRLGVSAYSLHRWLKADPRNPKSVAADREKQDLAAEVARLKKELRRVEEERDILRKAAAYFANQSE